MTARIIQRLFGIKLRTSIDEESSSKQRKQQRTTSLRQTQSYSGPFCVDVDHSADTRTAEIPELACCCRRRLSQPVTQQEEQSADMRGWQSSGGVAVLTAPGANLSTVNKKSAAQTQRSQTQRSQTQRRLTQPSQKWKRMRLIPEALELKFDFYPDSQLRSAAQEEVRAALSVSIPPEFRYLLPDPQCMRCTRSLDTALRGPPSKLDIGVSTSELDFPCRCFEGPHFGFSNVVKGSSEGMRCVHGNEPPLRSILNNKGLIPIRRKRNFNLAKSIKKFALKHKYYKWSARVSNFYSKRNRQRRMEEAAASRQRSFKQPATRRTKQSSSRRVRQQNKGGDNKGYKCAAALMASTSAAAPD